MTEILIALVVFVLAVAAVACLALAMHWGYKRDHGLVPYIFYPVLLVAALGVILSTRDLTLAEYTTTLIPTVKHPLVSWLSRLSSVFILLACGERILNRMVRPGKQAAPPWLLTFGFWTFVITNVLCPALFGRYPSISHEYVYMALFGQAVLLFSVADAELTIKCIRNSAFIFLFLSAIMLAVRPSQVLSMGYHGVIPFLTVRYAGLASHANTLGPLTVVFLMSLWHRPFERRWLTRFAWALGLGTLLLAQSKTSWISFLLSIACIAYFGQRDVLVRYFTDHRRPMVPSIIVISGMLMLSIIVAVVMFGDIGSKLDRLFGSAAGAELSSFSGRDAIWAVALQEWRANPIFGHGLTIWDLAFQISARLPNAVHAHSQFFQSASSAGTVGVAGLIIYLLVLGYLSMRSARPSGGISLALFLILVVRGVSEVPLAMTGFGIEAVTHLLLLIVLTTYRAPAARHVRQPHSHVALSPLQENAV